MPQPNMTAIQQLQIYFQGRIKLQTENVADGQKQQTFEIYFCPMSQPVS